MAKKTFQQINFVTGVVDGTLAYDFDVPGYFPEEEAPVPVRVPRRRRRSGTREQEWVREDSYEQSETRGEAIVSQLGGIMTALSAVGTIAAVALLLLVLLAKIQLIGISASALSMEKQINELENEHSRLTVRYEQVFNLKDVEETAIGVLGMQEPHEDQIYYLTGVSSADKAVVITHEDTGMFSLGLEDIMSSARSYLKALVN